MNSADIQSSSVFISPFQQKVETGLFSESKAAPAVAPKKVPVAVHPTPATQPSKQKSGGGLFSDEDEDDGGGLFGVPAAIRPQVKAEVKTKPKSTISLFDDDDDFFAATKVTSKANR